jgi:5-enolpyruvylshikimate-3-phosphate synthase
MGTAMRFLTAYFAVSEGDNFDGFSTNASPIKVLVEALEQLGLKLRMKGSRLSADSDNWPKNQIPSKHSCKCE